MKNSEIENAKKKVLVFGVFDGLHAGHIYLLDAASEYGLLTVSTPKDDKVMRMKGKLPKNSFDTRVATLMTHPGVYAVVPSDEDNNTWEVLQRVQPDIVVLGYDQGEMKSALEAHIQNNKLIIDVVVLDSHNPHIYKSSLLA